MRYCTKEWFWTAQKTSLHLLLKVNKKAETFNEDFYRKLYAKKLAERIALYKGVSEVKAERIFPKWEFENKEDYERALREYKPPVFDPEQTKREFAAQHRREIKRLRESLPKEILDKTADVRVLSLDVASAEVKRLITAYCKENKRKVRRAFKELNKAEKRDFGSEENMPEFCRESLHDCTVTSCRIKGKDLVLDIDHYGGFTNAVKVIFKNAEIVEREGRLAGTDWLYDEVYKCERGLEIHALLWRYGELRYLTVRCADAVIIHEDE